MTMMDDIPNPGSPEAQALGCICATMDNGYGRHPYMGWDESGVGRWSIRMDCALHGWAYGDGEPA